MKYNAKRQKLAIGTEEGFVCIFDVVKEGLNFDKILDKQEGRVLSLDWHLDGFHIVTGSTDTLRLWDVESGHPLQRMSTGRSERNLETTVWSVLMLDDFTVVSGDSRGKISFWKSQNGTLIDCYQSHKADILTLACNQEQNVIYASGVDPTIVHFQPMTKAEGKRKWMKSIQRHANSHDVHAILALNEVKRVVSVGVDANLFVDNPGKKSPNLRYYPPFAWGNKAATFGHVLALKHDQTIEIWTLGRQEKSPIDMDEIAETVKVVKIEQEPVKVMDIQCNESETIQNFAICPQYLAYSTKNKLKVLRFDLKDLAVSKVAISVTKAPHLLTFFDNNKLLIADTSGLISLFALNNESANLIFQQNFNVAISHLVIDSGEMFVMADFQNNITIFDLTNEKIQCKLPKYSEAPISCLAIQPKSKTVIVVYSNHHIVECCSKTGKYTKLSQKLEENVNLIPKEWWQKSKPTLGILFPQAHLSAGILSKKTDTIMFYDQDSVAVLDRQNLMNENGSASASKQLKKGGHTEKKEDFSHVMRLTKCYQHLVFLATLPPESNQDLTCPLVAVEVKPQTLESQLPPSIRRKKFGAM